MQAILTQSPLSASRLIFTRVSSLCPTAFTRTATKKAKGSSKNGRDSAGRRLGNKVSDGEFVQTGNVLVRQRGTPKRAGLGVGCGRDHTLYALQDGLVRFVRSTKGQHKGRVYLRIEEPPPQRLPSIERKIRRQELKRYNGPILHMPR